VKASSLRAAYLGATVSALLALLSAEPAHAHVEIRPAVLERGEVTEIRVELPGISPGPELVRLEIEGDEIDVLSSRRIGSRGPESLWTARLRATGEPGAATIVLRPVYANGDEVEFEQVLTVVPPDEASPFRWSWVLIGVAVALGLAAPLVLVRRRSA
jgi:hypothetical protein